jgi:antitoxin VapB
MTYTPGINRDRKRADDSGSASPRPTAEAADDNKPEEPCTAKLFMHGRSQAVRLPKEFRFPGSEVRVSRFADGVLLQPLKFDVDAWLARLDSYRDIPFMEDGREQPEMPNDDDELSFD